VKWLESSADCRAIEKISIRRNVNEDDDDDDDDVNKYIYIYTHIIVVIYIQGVSRL